MYEIFKSLHATTAVVSISFFITRFIWKLKQSPVLQRKWVKISPHINDTILLLSAIYLVIASEQYPFVDAWVTAKLILLFVYIGLGMVALKLGKTQSARLIAFVAAVAVFAFILSIAITKTPAGFFAS
jgi:uncharacterized membrane protein SirB2